MNMKTFLSAALAVTFLAGIGSLHSHKAPTVLATKIIGNGGQAFNTPVDRAPKSGPQLAAFHEGGLMRPVSEIRPQLANMLGYAIFRGTTPGAVNATERFTI